MLWQQINNEKNTLFADPTKINCHVLWKICVFWWWDKRRLLLITLSVRKQTNKQTYQNLILSHCVLDFLDTQIHSTVQNKCSTTTRNLQNTMIRRWPTAIVMPTTTQPQQILHTPRLSNKQINQSINQRVHKRLTHFVQEVPQHCHSIFC